jgi:hypothetical protein
MAADDDIERLLREVEGLDNPAKRAQPPTPAKGRDVAPEQEASGSARTSWALAMAGLGAVVGFLAGFLPGISVVSGALCAALGAFIAAYLGGPPDRFRK